MVNRRDMKLNGERNDQKVLALVQAVDNRYGQAL